MWLQGPIPSQSLYVSTRLVLYLHIFYHTAVAYVSARRDLCCRKSVWGDVEYHAASRIRDRECCDRHCLLSDVGKQNSANELTSRLIAQVKSSRLIRTAGNLSHGGYLRPGLPRRQGARCASPKQCDNWNDVRVLNVEDSCESMQ